LTHSTSTASAEGIDPELAAQISVAEDEHQRLHREIEESQAAALAAGCIPGNMRSLKACKLRAKDRLEELRRKAGLDKKPV